MTRPKPVDPDAITLADAATLLGLSKERVSRLRREGLLATLEGYPSYSRDDVEQYLANPWLTGIQAAAILQISHVRVSQLAAEDRIPVHFTSSGKRVYRRQQIEVVARARRSRRRNGHGDEGV
jgi:predicted XRE-type DNA-binding protein